MSFQRGNQEYFKTYKNKNTTFQNRCDAASKTVLRGNFIAKQAYLKIQEKHQLDNLSLHLKQLEKQETKNPKK